MTDIFIQAHGIKRNYLSTRNANSGWEGGCCKDCGKKADDTQGKFDYADALFNWFKSGTKISCETWFDFVQYLVPLYHKKTTPSMLRIVKKVLEKLSTFEEEYRSKWEGLTDIQIRNYHVKSPSLPTCSVNEWSKLDIV